MLLILTHICGPAFSLAQRLFLNWIWTVYDLYVILINHTCFQHCKVSEAESVLTKNPPPPFSNVLWGSLLCSRARNWPLFWSKWIQPTNPYLIFVRSILILPLHTHLNGNICNDLYISFCAADSKSLENILVSQLHQTDSLVVSQIYFIHMQIVFVFTSRAKMKSSLVCVCLTSFHPLTLSWGLVIFYINFTRDTPWTFMGEYGHSSTNS
jgi:hypothetical protein